MDKSKFLHHPASLSGRLELKDQDGSLQGALKAFTAITSAVISYSTGSCRMTLSSGFLRPLHMTVGFSLSLFFFPHRYLASGNVPSLTVNGSSELYLDPHQVFKSGVPLGLACLLVSPCCPEKSPSLSLLLFHQWPFRQLTVTLEITFHGSSPLSPQAFT